MQTRQHEDRFSAQRDHYEGVDSAPDSAPRSRESAAGELRRYDEEEVVTKPWPPSPC
jgi:hypothetical protein